MNTDSNSTDRKELKKPPYPTVYCDENLTVADISPSANSLGFAHLRGVSLKDRLSEKDIKALLSLLKAPPTENGRALIIDINKTKGVKCAYVTPVRLFGKNFFEMRIFRSRISMFKDFDVSRLMLCDVPFLPEYDVSRDRRAVNNSRDALKKVFSSGYLRNLYYCALDPLPKTFCFDAEEATRCIIADLSYALDLGDVKFSLSVQRAEDFSHKIIDVTNYVNLVSLLMKICSAVSASGKVSSSLSFDADKVSLLFVTEAKKSETLFFGGFAFDFLSDAYPEIASFVWAAKYISELFGIRCYAELSGENTLAVELLMKSAPPDVEIGVMHPDYEKLSALCDLATDLSKYLDNEEVKKYFFR